MSSSFKDHLSKQFENAKKLKEARKIAKSRAALKYRHENIEERRRKEMEYHRNKRGIPLELPPLKIGHRTVPPLKP